MLGSGPFGRQVAGMLERCRPGVGLRSGEGRIADTVARCGRGQFPQIPVMRPAAGRGGPAGGEALAFLLRTTAVRAPRTVTRISLDACSAASFVAAAGSGCPHCSPRPAAAAVGDDVRTGG